MIKFDIRIIAEYTYSQLFETESLINYSNKCLKNILTKLRDEGSYIESYEYCDMVDANQDNLETVLLCKTSKEKEMLVDYKFESFSLN
jgi:hypothetical protein